MCTELQARSKRQKERNSQKSVDSTDEAKEESEEKTESNDVVKIDTADDQSKESETPADAVKSDENQESSTPKPINDESERDDKNDETSTVCVTEDAATAKRTGIIVGDDNLIEIEDPDDYLMYLETILMKIHARFYEFHDETKQVSRSKLVNIQLQGPRMFFFLFLPIFHPYHADTRFENLGT